MMEAVEASVPLKIKSGSDPSYFGLEENDQLPS